MRVAHVTQTQLRPTLKPRRYGYPPVITPALDLDWTNQFDDAPVKSRRPGPPEPMLKYSFSVAPQDVKRISAYKPSILLAEATF